MTNITIEKQKIPLLDLNAQYNGIEEDIFAAFKEVFNSKQFIMGPKVVELEEKIASYCNAKYAIGVSSGTDALVLALMALGIKQGDEVITTPFTFFSTAGSISRLGAKPVFVDIDPVTFNIDSSLIEAKITNNTKAIIPVHLFGQMADMDPIMAIAKKYNLAVVEDSAQAIGSEYKGKRAGSIGDLGCFSFFPSKNLGACGDGGIVTTNDEALAEKCRVMRVHGSKPKYHHHVIGGNFRLDPLQAAILLVKLPYLEGQHEGRIKNAQFYNEQLNSNFITPVIGDSLGSNSRMIYNQYTFRVQNRTELQGYLKDFTIGNMVYYPVPLHLQKCFEDLGYKEGDCLESEKAAQEVLSVPIYPELTKEQLHYIVDVLNSF
jgi:dTDP-4-amino-4,6-dideoxygalactose transaminase